MSQDKQTDQGRLSPGWRRFFTILLGNERLIDAMLGPAADTASEETRLQMQAALAADDLLTADSRAASLPCNDFPELCDRPADEVAYATSHNRMSIAEYGWIWPMHDGTVTDQLNAGVRSLLIDTHYLDTKEKQDSVLASLPPEVLQVAQQAIAGSRRLSSKATSSATSSAASATGPSTTP